MPRHEEIADEGLRAMLQQAHDQMRGGDATEAVRTCTSAFLAMVEQHPELIKAKVPARGGEQPMVMLWPQLGANLSEDSVSAGKLEIAFERDFFSSTEAMTYYDFTVETAVHNNI
jgi:hypothetical protein